MIQEETIKIDRVFGGDSVHYDKKYPTEITRPLLKKLKSCDKIIMKFSQGSYYEGYVVALNGGDMWNTIHQSAWGDQIQLFVLPKKKYHFMQGLQTFWLCDIGIGKTKEEADDTYQKHDWFKRSKARIANDRFWGWWAEASPEEKLNHRKEWDHELKLTKNKN